MTVLEARAWVNPFLSMSLMAGARACFPDEPPLYATAYRLLLLIGYRRGRGKRYEEFYAKLPDWARWRDRLPVDLMVKDGRKFKTRPEKRTVNLCLNGLPTERR